LGNITSLLNKIKPAVESIQSKSKEMNDDEIEEVSIKNVQLSIERIRKESPVLLEMEKNNEIEIVGASYHVSNGKVIFF
jgi:carbonic anhydrase